MSPPSPGDTVIQARASEETELKTLRDDVPHHGQNQLQTVKEQITSLLAQQPRLFCTRAQSLSELSYLSYLW